MGGKTSKTSILAEALSLSGEEAKAFGDEVNRLLILQGHTSVSFADIARIARSLPGANRTTQTVAAHLLHDASGVNNDPGPKQPKPTPPKVTPRREDLPENRGATGGELDDVSSLHLWHDRRMSLLHAARTVRSAERWIEQARSA